MNTINTIIQKNSFGGKIYDYSEVAHIADGHYDHQYEFSKTYFFFKEELDLQATENYQTFLEYKMTTIRHLVPSKGKYFDYIYNKEYNTLQEWATDNGRTLDSVVYGVNHVHLDHRYRPLVKYITLKQLVKHLDPTWVEEVEPVAEKMDLDEIMSAFDRLAVDLQNLKTRVSKMQ